MDNGVEAVLEFLRVTVETIKFYTKMKFVMIGKLIYFDNSKYKDIRN